MAEILTFIDEAEVAESFQTDLAKRTITGLLVPWGKVASPNGGLTNWRFAPGAFHWSAPKRVKLNLGHDRKETVGVAVRLENTAQGLSGSFRVAPGQQGDSALALAAEDILDGFSVEIDFQEGDGWTPDPSNKSVRVVDRVTLRGVALTGYPAFDDARVERIAAARQEGTTMDLEDKHQEKVLSEDEGAQLFEQKMADLAGKITDSQVKLTQELGQSIGESVSAGVRAALEDIGNPQSGPQPVSAARYSVTREASVYSFDGRGESLVRDAWAAARNNDDEAIARLRKFRAQSEDMAELVHHTLNFAPQTTTTAGSLIPPGYRPDLYVSDLFKERPLVNLASQGTIANASPFTVPKFGSVTGGSATHVEGTNPSDGSLTFSPQVVSPQAISGRIVLTREIVDSSNPAIDQIAFAEMRESYNRQTEAIVYTLLNGTLGAGGTITAGFVPSGAQAVTTAGGTDNQTLAKALRKAIADYFFARFMPITGAAMGQGATGRLVQAVDTTQRPLFPWVAPSNPQGLANASSGGYQVDQVTIVPAWAMTGTAAGDSQIFLLRSSDLWVWESPLLTFRFEEKQGPANIELNIFAYFGTALLRPVGLSGIRIT
jgi:HK97 family phage prohead protease/HK97 family phage major capsid protein